MEFNYPEMLELKEKGFCIIRNFERVSNYENLIADLEASLIQISLEGAQERFEKAGFSAFGTIDFMHPFIFRFLDSKILDDLNKIGRFQVSSATVE